MLSLILLFCITLPHILYAAIWTYPDLWRKRFQKESVAIFAKTAGILKVVQFGALAIWMVGRSGTLRSLIPAPASTLVALFSLASLAVGQVLNVAIYKAIGRDGVYYGFKLGRPVPWHHGFPFNVVSHPQYVGSVLTILGCGGLFWRNLPPGSFMVLLYWCSLYLLTGLQEQYI